MEMPRQYLTLNSIYKVLMDQVAQIRSTVFKYGITNKAVGYMLILNRSVVQNNVSQCQFNLPISILLSTTQHNPITLTNIISTYNSGDIFTTSCQLCRGTETCYGPTYTPTYNPTIPTKSPITTTYSPTFAPTNSLTLTPTYIINITTSIVTIVPTTYKKVTYVDIQYTLLTIVIILTVSVIFILTCYRFYKMQSDTIMLKSIKYTALIAMFSFICSYFSWLISIY
eukprot:479255_1